MQEPANLYLCIFCKKFSNSFLWGFNRKFWPAKVHSLREEKLCHMTNNKQAVQLKLPILNTSTNHRIIYNISVSCKDFWGNSSQLGGVTWRGEIQISKWGSFNTYISQCSIYTTFTFLSASGTVFHGSCRACALTWSFLCQGIRGNAMQEGYGQ